MAEYCGLLFYVGLIGVTLVSVFKMSQGSCGLSEFQCGNGNCAEGSVRCNYVDDCVDNSDEANCTHPTVDMSMSVVIALNDRSSKYSAIVELFGNPVDYAVKLSNTSYNEQLPINIKRHVYYQPDFVRAVAVTFQSGVFFTANGKYGYSVQLVYFRGNTFLYATVPINKQVNGLAFDWMSRNVYWTDLSYKLIGMLPVDGDFPLWKPVVYNLISPRAVAVNPFTSNLFFIEGGSGPNSAEIVRCDLSGDNCVVLVNASRGGLVSPSKLAVDYTTDKLYWLDSAARQLGSVNCDGTELATWTHALFSRCSSLTIHANFMFFGDNIQPKLYIYHLTTMTFVSSFTLPGETLPVADMASLVEPVQSYFPNPCTVNNGGCSQICYTVGFNRSVCDCSPGYFIASDGLKCLTRIFPESEKFLLVTVAGQENIYQLNPATSEVRAIFNTRLLRKVVAATFNPVQRVVYMIVPHNEDVDTIERVSLDGIVDGTIHMAEDGSQLMGLAVDDTSGILYYTDFSLGVVASMTTDGLYDRVVISNKTQHPRAIIVDATNSRLYWTDCSMLPTIQTSRVDGTDRRTIVTGETGTCFTGITADFKEQTLYWTSVTSARSSVEKISVNGSVRTTLFTETNATYSGLTYMDQCLFISDNNNRYVMNLNLTTNTLSSQSPGLFANITDIKYCPFSDPPPTIATTTTTLTTSITTSSSTTTTTTTDVQSYSTTERVEPSDKRTQAIIIGVCVGGGVFFALVIIIVAVVCLVKVKWLEDKHGNYSTESSVGAYIGFQSDDQLYARPTSGGTYQGLERSSRYQNIGSQLPPGPSLPPRDVTTPAEDASSSSSSSSSGIGIGSEGEGLDDMTSAGPNVISSVLTTGTGSLTDIDQTAVTPTVTE